MVEEYYLVKVVLLNTCKYMSKKSKPKVEPVFAAFFRYPTAGQFTPEKDWCARANAVENMEGSGAPRTWKKRPVSVSEALASARLIAGDLFDPNLS